MDIFQGDGYVADKNGDGRSFVLCVEDIVPFVCLMLVKKKEGSYLTFSYTTLSFDSVNGILKLSAIYRP